MVKALVTKLKASTNNTDLLKYGELRIPIAKTTDSLSSVNSGISVSSTQDSVVRIIGNGYFTDSTFTNNLGKEANITNVEKTLYLSNGDFYLSIENKYVISSLGLPTRTVDFDIKNLRWSYELTNFIVYNCKGVFGDVSSLKELVKLAYFTAMNTNVKGDLSFIEKMNNLINFSFNGNNPADLSVFSSKSKLTQINGLKNVTGDIAKLPNSCYYIGQISGKFTWSNRDTNGFILGSYEVTGLADIDAMLINQANCKVTTMSGSRYKNIIFVGSRTSASDDAVATLQAKGYTVTIL